MCPLLPTTKKQAQSKTNIQNADLWPSCLDVLFFINQKALMECKFLLYEISEIKGGPFPCIFVELDTQVYKLGKSVTNLAYNKIVLV